MPRKLARIAAAFALTAALCAAFIYCERPADEIATHVVNRGLSNAKTVALTFDDGPHPITTALLLDTLRRHGIRATFFVVGEKAEENPALLKRIAADGHQVACHTYSHDNLVTMNSHELENELTYWERDVDGILGRGSRYLRPPGGDFNADTISMVRRRGYVLALWSVNPGDWHNPPPKTIVKTVLDKVHPGAVILMHDDGINTVRALPAIITGLQKRGYHFATLERLVRTNEAISPQTAPESVVPIRLRAVSSRASSPG